MKRLHKVERFDYSKIESREDMRYFGIHPKSGRVHIDTKRYKKILDEDGISEYLPGGLFTNRNTPYFIPAFKSKYDYKFNMFKDLIGELRQEWFNEYKPLFKYIKSPKDVYEQCRTNALMFTSNVDDLDEIECDAMLASIHRRNKYVHVMNSLYCSFISKISTEIDRIILIVMCELGYKSNDFNYNSFVKFADGLQKNKYGKKISQLHKYNSYNLLHKINNFLKHNTVTSYNELKKFYPNNVASIENGITKLQYENGMYAGDWIIVKENYIDNLFDKLIEFCKDFCIEFLNENVEESSWNYDDYFRYVYYEIKNLNRYYGV